MKENHKVFVKKVDLKSKGLYPSSQELYDLMHIVTCERAVERWQEEWSFCPVCLARYEADGWIGHKERKEILV
jgi:hypothetical protein